MILYDGQIVAEIEKSLQISAFIREEDSICPNSVYGYLLNRPKVQYPDDYFIRMSWCSRLPFRPKNLKGRKSSLNNLRGGYLMLSYTGYKNLQGVLSSSISKVLSNTSVHYLNASTFKHGDVKIKTLQQAKDYYEQYYTDYREYIQKKVDRYQSDLDFLKGMKNI